MKKSSGCFCIISVIVAALGSFAKSLLAEVCVNRAAAEATVRQERGHKIFRLMAVVDFCFWNMGSTG